MLQRSNAELHELLNNFTLLTGIKIAVNDCNQTFGFSSHPSDFCDKMQANSRFHKACVTCDIRAQKNAAKLRRGILYRCHVGFWEYIAPIFSDDVVVGFVTTGMFVDGTAEEYQVLKQNFFAYNVCGEDFEAVYASAPRFTPDQIVAACNIVEACISHINYKNLIKINYLNKMQKIDQYIADHLSDDLSIAALCKHFSMTRANLYEQFGAYCSQGIAAFIREKRLTKSRELMQESSMSITEIATLVGYPDYNYFSKVFRRQYGISPRNFRKSKLNRPPSQGAENTGNLYADI